MLFTCCTQYASKFNSDHRSAKCHISFQSQEGQCQRMLTLLLSCIRFTQNKVMLNILQGRPQQYVNGELPDVQAGFRKGRGTRDQMVNKHLITEKAKEFQKNIYFCFIDYAKAFDCVDHDKLWKILKEMGIPDHLTCLLRNLYAVRKQQLELDVEIQTGSK